MNGGSRANDGAIVVISGATGFLGSALCRHLVSHGYRVRGLARDVSTLPAGPKSIDWYACSLPNRLSTAC